MLNKERILARALTKKNNKEMRHSTMDTTQKERALPRYIIRLLSEFKTTSRFEGW